MTRQRHPHQPGRRARRSAPIALAVAGALAASTFAAPALAAGSAAPSAGPADINGYRSVGYFMGDAPVSRDWQVADLVTSGALASVTHINYAFGNVTKDLVCDIVDEPGEGDPGNDFLRLVPAQDSVDGKADTATQKLAGNFNQLRKLKKISPDTKILVSLGGWTWSDNFSEAASTAAGREKLVSSCIDLYLRGNLPVVDGKGGPGTAAGIFDGIDIDWEWPVNGGETANARPEDKENFLALLQEFRRQLDAYGQPSGTHYLLTAFAPAGGWNTNAGDWGNPAVLDAVDFLNVQGYDYAGGWTPDITGHQGNLHPDGDNNWGLAIDNALAAYGTSAAAKAKLNVGLAAYGQGWEGVTDGATKAWTSASGALGTKPYYEIRNVGKGYFDATVGASWRWDGDQWWSLDDPRSVNAKAEWFAAQGYGGAMWWDLSGDYKNELVGTLGSTLRAATPGPTTPAVCAVPWYPTAVYTGGEVVSRGGVEYKASWWTRNQEPGTGNGSPWTKIGSCGTAPKPPVEPCAPAWSASATYTEGARVSRAGVNYTAQWWTTGEQPGSVTWGSWDPSALCR